MSDTSLLHFTSDSDQEEFENQEDSKENVIKGTRSTGAKKKPGACVDCKSVKVRCEPVPGERKCRRCQAKNLPCRPRDRKKRKAADTHEELQEKAHSQDLQIQQLLLQYDRLQADNKIRQWISRAHPQAPPHSYDRTVECYKWLQGGTSPEDASAIFFNLPNRAFVPEIIKHCALYPEEITELFTLFFKHVNSHFSILDEVLHTPQHLITTSPFLFTVVCAVSSRHYVSRPEVYPLAMDFARDAAGKGLVEGKQSVDTCQAYLLLAVYPVPKKKWVEDRSWLLMGVAIRMAMELKLNHPPPDDLPERERLNCVRTWLNCYCVDGSHAIQFGKMPMLRLDDYLARTTAFWYRSSHMNQPVDVHLCAYVQILIIMAKWRMTITGQCKNDSTTDGERLATALDTHQLLSDEMGRWVKIYAEEFSYNPLPVCDYRGNTTQLIASYLKLVVLSNAFTSGCRLGLSSDSPLFRLALNAARNVIQIMVERLAPTGFLRYAMDANFLYVSYAASYLIQLLRPKFLSLLNETELKEIILAVTNLIQVLGSRDVALDGRHTPALYSRFISSLLKEYCPEHYLPMVQDALSAAANSRASPASTEGHDPQTDAYYSRWPDISSLAGSSSTPEIGMDTGMVYHRHGDPDMDFSLNHFVKTVTQGMPQPMGPSPEVRFMGASGSSSAWGGWTHDRMGHLHSGDIWRI